MRREGGWHLSVTGVVRRLFEAAVEDNIPFLASALSFDLLLTAIPFFVLMLAVAGSLAQHEVTAQQIELHQLVERFLPPDARVRDVERFLEGVIAQRGKLTLVGVPLFLWFSTRLFGALRVALNEVFDTDESRPWPVAKLIDLAMVVATGSLFLAGALLTARVGGLAWFWRLALEGVAFGLSTLLFAVVFKVMPSRPIYWRTALVAAAFCALAFEVARRLYAWYLTSFATLDRFASDENLVAFLLFFLWIYYMAFVFLLGGEVAETYDLMRLRRGQRVRLG